MLGSCPSLCSLLCAWRLNKSKIAAHWVPQHGCQDIPKLSPDKSNLLSALTSMLALSSFILWMNEKFSLWVIKKYAGFSHTHLSARVDGG